MKALGRVFCGCARPNCGCSHPPLHGIVQHSFALQMAAERRPFYGRTNRERVRERFNYDKFRARQIGKLNLEPGAAVAHSPLAGHGLTTIESVTPRFIGPEKPPDSLPKAFKWAEGQDGEGKYEDPRLIFADRFDDEDDSPSINDFLISEHKSPKDRPEISQLLLELVAHKRSRFFGFALANRFVNVFLPHAVLCPSGKYPSPQAATWFLQPLVSFVRGGRDRGRLRSTYPLTFFLIPVECSTPPHDLRPMTLCEIGQMVNAGWGFAAVPPLDRSPRFEVTGPLVGYLSKLARYDLEEIGEQRDTPLTLRQIVERIAFGVGLSLAQGSTGRADMKTARRIGNDVVASLASARVSSVVVVDEGLTPDEVRKPTRDEPSPGSLSALMETLADPIRTANADDRKAHRYRLDRPMVDDDIYAVGVLPIKRCMVVVSREDAQFGIRESALMQAGSVAGMTIGAATAIGTMREIDRRLEHLEDGGPMKIAEIDREIADDLGEIYDLDITRESYRQLYRRFRDRLGITRDYQTLQGKMEALYRSTSTIHGDSSQRLLAWLTAGIVALSLLILIGTVILAGKGG